MKSKIESDFIDYCAKCGEEKPEVKNSNKYNMDCCYQCQAEMAIETISQMITEIEFYEVRIKEYEAKLLKYQNMFGEIEV